MQQNAADIYTEGYRYYSGKSGYPLDNRKAYEYFKKAADLGLPEAMNSLGVMYLYGEYVPASDETAVQWFMKAVQTDERNPYAAYNLGRMLFAGRGIQQNMIQAYKYLKRAVDLGKDNTHTVYGQACYLTGYILISYYKNYNEAYPYFWEAAKNCDNDPDPWLQLGFLCEKGAVPLRDFNYNNTRTDRDNLALEFYKKAAELGDAEAMDNVGRIYGSYKLYDKARPYIEKAASMGYEPAKKRLKMLGVAESGSVWGYFK